MHLILGTYTERFGVRACAVRLPPGWAPTRPGLIDDLNAGHYFAA